MDCAPCVQKVERAVSRLPGAHEVQPNFTIQTLRLNESRTTRAALEELPALGYTTHTLTPREEQREAAPALPAPSPGTTAPRGGWCWSAACCSSSRGGSAAGLSGAPLTWFGPVRRPTSGLMKP
ncbi:cation transporter [Deinococcus apachensis]|uniref:cation transporter n=1 Tax=Deinococcus apachensis TaxID=309886 RepID=UPI000476C4CE|nr:heavy metal-associated domain-containing protein [Deinococcus apachensis]